MSTNFISIAQALRLIGSFTFILAILTVLTSVLAYLPAHPDFSFFTTYLSDIGDTQGWPQIFFNSGTLLAAPLRYIIIVLIVFRLLAVGNIGKGFVIAILVVGVLSTIGTVLMTAVPFSVAPAVHKSGIGLYFLGVVFLQSLIGIKELSLKELTWSLPIWSFAIVVCFLIFFVLLMLYEMGRLGRNTPVFWEWMCFFTSTGWLAWHVFFLGK
ncbi:MAG: hypothetical protein ACK2TV_14610 [Anaerolineales bacterium]